MRDKQSLHKLKLGSTPSFQFGSGGSSKAQSATEYIATYGWAVLIIVIMIAVLYFFVLAPSTSAPEICAISSQDFYCQSFVFGSNSSFSSIGVVLTNSRQYTIKNPSLSLNTSLGIFPIPCTPNFVLPGGTVICNATFSNIVVNPGVLVSGSLTINATICTNLDPTEKNCIASPVQSTTGRFQTHSTQILTKPKISISLLVGNTSQLATGAGDNLTAVVKFFGVPIAGATVNFTYSSPITATIRPVFSTTDTNGNAYSKISTTENGVVTVYAQYGNVIASNTITFEKPAYVTYYSSNLIGSTSDVLTVDGIQYVYSQLPKTFVYSMGSSHTYSYSSPVSGPTTGTRYIYDTISGCGGSSQSGTITAGYNCTLFAVYTTQYSLTMASGSLSPTPQPSGATTTPAPGSYWYNSGSQVNIRASNTLAPNWIFDRWSCTGTNCYSGTSESSTIAISSTTSETAYFYSVLTQPKLSPSTQTIDQGQKALITATMPDTGITPYSYAWLANFNGGSYNSASECSQPSGSATASQQVQCSFSSGSTTSTGTYNFYITITDSSPSSQTTSSSTVSVLVNPQLSMSSISPSSPVTIDYGQSTSVSMTASGGTSPYTYSWTSTVTSGACLAPTGLGTSSSFTFTPSTSDEGCTFTFTGTAKDSVGETVSGTTAGITVNPQLSMSSISPSSPVTIDYGQSTSVSMTASGGTSPYTYSWTSTVTSGACPAPTGLGTSSSFTFTPSTSDEGCTFTFTGTAKDSVGETVSGTTAGITVNPSPTVSISPQSSTIFQGQSSLLSSAISGGTSPYTYQWYNDTSGSGIAISGATASSYSVFGGATGTFTYYLMIRDNVGETATSSIATVSVNPVTTTSTTSTTTTTTSSTSTSSSTSSTTTIKNTTVSCAISESYPDQTGYQWSCSSPDSTVQCGEPECGSGPYECYSVSQGCFSPSPSTESQENDVSAAGYPSGTYTNFPQSGSICESGYTQEVYSCSTNQPVGVDSDDGGGAECTDAVYNFCSQSSSSTTTTSTTATTSTSTSSTTTTISYAVLVGGPCSLSSTCTSTGLDCNTGYDCTDGIDTGSCSNTPSPCN